MNQAVQKVQGRYVLFLNCGDRFFDRSVLSDAASFMEKQESTEVGRGRSYIFTGISSISSRTVLYIPLL